MESSSFSGSVPKQELELLEGYIEKYAKNFKAHRGSKSLPKQQVVLITGCTGTLGSYLLHEFIRDTNVRKIYAVNRLGSHTSLERQRTAFQDRGLDPFLLDSDRVVMLDADTAKEDFDIPSQLYESIRDEVTLIIANAWKLNFNRGIESFEPNVRSVRNLVDLALSSPFEQPPKFLSCSTIGLVVGDYHGGEYREGPAQYSQVANQGYSRSKYVAELILERSGLEYCNCRIGQLAGSLQNGAWNATDWFPLMCRAGEKLGILPLGTATMSWIRTDECAKVMREISKLPRMPPVLNIVTPKPIIWNDMIKVVADSLGVKLVPYKTWVEAMEKEQDAVANPALKIMSFWKAHSSDIEPEIGGLYGQAAFGQVCLNTELAQKLSPYMRNIAPLNEDDFNRMVEYWRKVGRLRRSSKM